MSEVAGRVVKGGGRGIGENHILATFSNALHKPPIPNFSEDGKSKNAQYAPGWMFLYVKANVR